VETASHCFGIFSHSSALAADYLLHDWSSSALGSPDTWPMALRHAVCLMLDSRFPMFIAWGSEQAFLYNDSYAPLLGKKHPAALGAPMKSVWPEVWGDIAPLIDTALAGKSTYREDVPRTLWWNGCQQEHNFTVSYSPLWGDDNAINGVFCVVAETTDRVLLERRQALRLKVAETLRDLTAPEDIAEMAAELIGRHMKIRRAGYVEVSLPDSAGRAVKDWTDGSLASLSGKSFPLQIFGKDIIQLLSSGKTAVVDDVTKHPITASFAGVQLEFGIRARICVPIIKQGLLAAIFYLHDSVPRIWTEEDVAMVEDVVENVWGAIERARAERERLVAEERLQQGMCAARMLVWEWEIATQKATFSENARAIIGRPITRMESIWELVVAEDMSRMQAAHRHAIDKKDGYEEIVRIVRPDTNELVWLDVRGRVHCDAFGNPVFIRGITVDVSERMRTQAELARLNQALAVQVKQLEEAQNQQAFQLRLADMLRALSDPSEVFKKTSELLGDHLQVSRVLYGDYDTQQNLVTFHSEYRDGMVPELNGIYPIAAFGTENFASLVPGDTWISADMEHDPRTSSPDIWPTLEALIIYSAVAVPLSRNGALIACLFVGDSKPRQWTPEELRLIEDVAERSWTAIERTRAEDALRKADLHKDQFLAMLAHELRNPLAPISAAAELLSLAQLSPDHIRNTSAVIARQVNHMTELVNDLLDVSRVSRGLVELSKDEVDMRAILSEAVEQVRPLIDSRRHQLSMPLAPEPVYVLGDAKRLTQVLANLLSNAAKYTPEGGRIDVQIELSEEHAALRIIDNGMGISPELLPRVFQLFVQEKRTPDRSQGGLGIGLALVKHLIELHGGSVAAASAGHQMGSQFTILLPFLKNPSRKSASAEEPKKPSSPAGKLLRLLVVDDNRDAARMLAMLLETAGYHTAIEYDGQGALERAKRESFDACLLDIGLPGMDGNELARRLRGMPSARNALLIAITGYGQQFDRETSIASGFDHYFVKPVDPLKLFALLDGIFTASDAAFNRI